MKQVSLKLPSSFQRILLGEGRAVAFGKEIHMDGQIYHNRQITPRGQQ